jgi:5-methylcytosine-specific restriction endonuclease McrA
VSDVPAGLRRRVEERANGRCEYCQLAQAGQEARFHVDHVVPVAASGPTTFDNLALACVSCSLRKGARTSAADPTTGTDSRLFNPRVDRWADHFRWDSTTVVPLPPR